MSSLHEHILVVEDDTQIRNFICFTLEGEPMSAARRQRRRSWKRRLSLPVSTTATFA